MLYEENIKYNSKKYNTYQLLRTLSEDEILKPMTVNDAGLIKSPRDVCLKTPSEIKLSEYDPTLFEFQQFGS